jgi:hypothetical protein
VEQRSLEDLWTQRLPLIAEEAGFDPNRDTGSISPRSNVKTYVDPLAYFVGPVRTVYGGDPTKSYVHPKLNTLIDRKKQTVRSITGELLLDYGKGISVLNAPKAQGVTGFLKAAGGKFSTRNLQITSGNDYASLLVVSLDRQPLNVSKRVLVQVGTTLRPTGWQEKPATRKIGEMAAQRSRSRLDWQRALASARHEHPAFPCQREPEARSLARRQHDADQNGSRDSGRRETAGHAAAEYTLSRTGLSGARTDIRILKGLMLNTTVSSTNGTDGQIPDDMQAYENDYLFDLLGYQIIKQAISPDQLQRINDWVDAQPPREIGDWRATSTSTPIRATTARTIRTSSRAATFSRR